MYKKIFITTAIWILSVFAVWAQTPAGVRGYTVEYWLKADNPMGNNMLYSNGQNISTGTAWVNLSGITNRDFTRAGGTANMVQYVYGGLNFHPAFRWNATANTENVRLASSSAFTTGSANSYYVFIVSKPNRRATYERTLFCLTPGNTNPPNRSGLSWGTNGAGDALVRIGYSSSSNTGLNYTFTENAGDKPFGIMALSLPNTNVGTVYLNGRSITSATSNNYRWSGTTAIPYIGSEGDTYHPYNGDIQEIIMLSRTGNDDITTEDLNSIQSYLAIKYGISLAAGDYVNSAGIPVWTRGGDSYNNNIFGIGRDNDSGLYQKQSRSANDVLTTLFTGNKVTTLNSQNTGSINNDKSFVMLGSNGLEGTELRGAAITNGTQYNNDRIAAINDLNIQSKTIYKAQVTNYTDRVKLAVDMTEYLYVMVSSDENFTPANTNIYPIKSGIAEVSIDNTYKYIRYAGYSKAYSTAIPGGITSTNLRLWLNAGFI